MLSAGPVAARAVIRPWTCLAGRGRPGEPGLGVTLDGRPLAATRYVGWAQAFRLPAHGGHFRLRYDQGSRPGLLWLQGGVLLVVIVPRCRPPGSGRVDDAQFPDAPVSARHDVAGVGARRRR